MKPYRRDRMLSVVGHAAAEFVNRESNGRSLITVTDVKFSGKRAVEVFVSVMPEQEARAAMDFLDRRKSDFPSFLKEKIRARELPRVAFLLDPMMGSIEGGTRA
jgi:ribosome-binding factor A